MNSFKEIAKLAHRLMLVVASIVVLAGVSSIQISGGSVDLIGAEAHADDRSLHACGDELFTGDIYNHYTAHCNVWLWGAMMFMGLAIASVNAAIRAAALGSGGTLLGLRTSTWVALTVAYGGMAALYVVFGFLCDPNAGMCAQ